MDVSERVFDHLVGVSEQCTVATGAPASKGFVAFFAGIFGAIRPRCDDAPCENLVNEYSFEIVRIVTQLRHNGESRLRDKVTATRALLACSGACDVGEQVPHGSRAWIPLGLA